MLFSQCRLFIEVFENPCLSEHSTYRPGLSHIARYCKSVNHIYCPYLMKELKIEEESSKAGKYVSAKAGAWFPRPE
jgi:hypothetical protein